jgi:PAS domain S-box-containing protein
MAKHLAQALGADAVFVGEFVGGQVERVRTLAVFTESESDDFEFELAGSAAAQIALGKPVLCRDDAQRRCPADTALKELHAHAFAGVPLIPSEGAAPTGVLMAVYRKTVPNLSVAKSILEIFAPRAAAELERKQEHERLSESEQRYRAFVSLNCDGMWRIEFEQPVSTEGTEEQQLEEIYRYGYLAECNDALARQFGFERASQLTGWRLNDLAPLSNPSVREANLYAIRSKHHFTTVETAPLNSDGTRRHILRSQWGIVENGMLLRVWGTARDITDLKNIERELDASERQMADLLESLNLLVVMLHEDGTIAFCNKHLYQLTGWSSADVAGKSWFDLMIPPEDRDTARAAFASAKLQSEAGTHFECPLVGPEGRRWWIAWDSTSLHGADGNIVMSANVGRDVSEYKMLEAQFRQAQELESIGRLAGGVAHDFNNLLAVISGYNGVLLERTDPADPRHASLVEIRKAAEKGAELTHRLLTFSRRQIPRPEPLDWTALIADDEQMVHRLIGENIQLVTKLEPSLDLVRADASQLRQVLLNLVVNAWDAMPHGGTLTISTSNRELAGKNANRAGVPPGKYVQLTVTDTGIGMTEEVRRHLFEPFYTTKEKGKGTGLGLSTVYGIIRQHGGHIEVKSEPGKGASFKVLLPGLPAVTSPDVSKLSR